MKVKRETYKMLITQQGQIKQFTIAVPNNAKRIIKIGVVHNQKP